MSAYAVPIVQGRIVGNNTLDFSRLRIGPRQRVASPMNAIAQAVADEFGIPWERLYNEQRGSEKEAFARQVAMALCYELTGASGQAVGVHFRGRSSSAVSYAMRTVRERCGLASEQKIRAQIDALRERLA